MKKIKKIVKQITAVWGLINVFYWLKNFVAIGPSLLHKDHDEPTLSDPQSQLATARQFIEPTYIKWCNRMHCYARLHRKKWEFAYILQNLERHGMIAPGKHGLAFGCGQEPIPALLAKSGCSVLATDLDFDSAQQKGWVDSKEHAASAEILNKDGICPPDIFEKHVSFRVVNMNAIPQDLTGFDFLWSSCALEHLGSIEQGLAFIQTAMNCLKPGGLAVHTTEFNYSSDDDTIEMPELSLFRKQDMLRLKNRLEKEGHQVAPFIWYAGASKLDRHVDVPPFSNHTCLRLRHGRYDCTSIGLFIKARA